MRIAVILLAAAIACVPPVQAQEAHIAIGLAAPLSGSHSLLGKQLEDGARVGLTLFDGRNVRLEVADDRCSAEGGAEAGRFLVEREVPVVVGFLCTEAIEAALPVLSEAGIPVITPGVRTPSLTENRERTGWRVFRLAPRAGEEQRAVADILVRRWRDEFFAIVDDGTIYGRELAESLRAAAELAGLKPVFVDTFRPQLDNQIALMGRLRRAGATHVFVGGDRADIAVMARDAAELGYDLTIAGGEALQAEDDSVPLAEGVLTVAPQRPADQIAPPVRTALESAGVVPEGYVVPALTAVRVAATAVTIARREGISVAEALAGRDFGDVRFDESGELAGNPYRLFRYDGRSFQEVE